MAKIGILITDSMFRSGGIFQYAMSLVYVLNSRSRHSYVIFYESDGFKEFCDGLDNCKLVKIVRPASIYTKYMNVVAILLGFNSYIRKLYDPIISSEIDLLISPDSLLTLNKIGVPYVVAIHDLMHKYYAGLPEYQCFESLKRDCHFKRSSSNAVLVVAESNNGKNDLVKHYKVPDENVRVIPYCPTWFSYKYKDMDQPYAVSVVRKYDLPERFFFYPAQFWSHKNHERLINAIYRLREVDGMKANLVLAGSPRKESGSTYSRVKNLLVELNLCEQVKLVGYIKEKEIVAMYKQSVGLVYPTLIGPTNMPPLEAMLLGTPVACSNLLSMPEQIGSAGVLFDPFDVDDIADKLKMMWTDQELRERLVKAGFQRSEEFSKDVFASRWSEVIEESLARSGVYVH